MVITFFKTSQCVFYVMCTGSHFRKIVALCHAGKDRAGPRFNKTSYCEISISFEAVRFVFRIVLSLWNLTGASAAVLPGCLSNFKAMWWFKLQIWRLRDFTRSYDKTSYRMLWNGALVAGPSEIMAVMITVVNGILLDRNITISLKK